jgi:transcription elongation GreA/GreB family factor
MSRAFVKETSDSAPPPERMVSDGPNLVTANGFAQIEAKVTGIEEKLKTETNVLLRETLERDLRYWTVKKASAEIVPPPEGNAIAFGSTVTIERAGRKQVFRIVGEDEADPKQGLISWHAPLAQAVLGLEVDDITEASPPLDAILIVNIQNS